MNLKNEKLIQAACMGNKQALEQLLILCQPDKGLLGELVLQLKMLKMLCKSLFG
ncbi:hypothetical protein [Gilliamella sp. B2911]|uniref:hypothetical protein n=1 Tax=Gilliamella sp. B2911 TaxID=2817980 RepID=UPI002269FF76|nr:hypothetical protein [Gilliamella sp. B2911]MCX8662840.1 hypothetical protein [Gilliamella sp. B2911]